MIDENSKATGLFGLYASQQAEIRTYYHASQVFLEHLKEVLRETLGFPETYQTFGGGSNEPWLRLYKWNSENNTVQHVDSCSDVDTMNEQGELEAAIGITLAHKENSHPKTTYWLPVKIKLTRDEVLVALGLEQQLFTYDRRATDFPDFCQAVVETLEKSLRASVYDQAPAMFARSRGIGFVQNN